MLRIQVVMWLCSDFAEADSNDLPNALILDDGMTLLASFAAKFGDLWIYSTSEVLA